MGYDNNIRIKSLEVMKAVNPLKPGLHIEFKKSICFLVGDNGVGKSTIMDCLADTYKFKDDTYLKRSKMKENIRIETEGEFPVDYMDFHASDKRFSGSFGEDIMLQMGQMRASSGQVTISLLNKILKRVKKTENGVIIFDEPCRGMSIRNQLMICNLMKGIVEKMNCQLIVTTHSIIILGKFEGKAQYFDVGKGKDVTYEEFYKSQCIAAIEDNLGNSKK
jgi:predicted ATPase